MSVTHSIPHRLSGLIASSGAGAHASVRVVDAEGRSAVTQADAQGWYALDLPAMRAPLLVSACLPAFPAAVADQDPACAPWARSLAAILPALAAGDASLAHVNALTDWIVSGVAKSLGFRGPQGLVEQASCAGVTQALIRPANESLLLLIRPALLAAGLAGQAFDPVCVPAPQQAGPVSGVLDLLVHNRGFHNDSGLPGATLLFDADYRFVGRVDAHSAPEPLDLAHAARVRARQRDPAVTRLFIVGDSTAANYERARFPRAGWGQVLGQCFRPEIQVINAAKAGRSSRSFFRQGYFAQLAALMRPGDYLFINFGHNDQSANSARPVRGVADVAHLATYPDDDAGRPQHPAGQPELAFRHALERYIAAARSLGVTPVLLTTTTRLTGRFPAGPAHRTAHGPQTDYAFVGDYAATIRNTARANQVALIDLEVLTLALANCPCRRLAGLLAGRRPGRVSVVCHAKQRHACQAGSQPFPVKGRAMAGTQHRRGDPHAVAVAGACRAACELSLQAGVAERRILPDLAECLPEDARWMRLFRHLPRCDRPARPPSASVPAPRLPAASCSAGPVRARCGSGARKSRPARSVPHCVPPAVLRARAAA